MPGFATLLAGGSPATATVGGRSEQIEAVWRRDENGVYAPQAGARPFVEAPGQVSAS